MSDVMVIVIPKNSNSKSAHLVAAPELVVTDCR